MTRAAAPAPVTTCTDWPCSTSPETSRLEVGADGVRRCVSCKKGYGAAERAKVPEARVTVYDALCLQEPWLQLILDGLKTLETRTKCLRRQGGDVVLTSSLSIDQRAWKNPRVGGRLSADGQARVRSGVGCLAALVTLGDCRPGVPGADDAAAMIGIQTPKGPRWVYPISSIRLLQRRNTVRLRPSGDVVPGSKQGFFKIPAAEVRRVPV